jgi:enamine deaminase RidA (YjgF/YER057c/UK114 family)
VTEIDFASPPTLSTPAGYSQVVSLPATGRLVWTSGQVPIAADGTIAPAGDWEAQTRLAFENVGHALAAGGALEAVACVPV